VVAAAEEGVEATAAEEGVEGAVINKGSIMIGMCSLSEINFMGLGP
jgi:hypothetical protein